MIRHAEDELGVERTDPSDPRWLSDASEELFDRDERAMGRLLTEDTSETRAGAYCHYHLTVEGILARTGYYGVQTNSGGDAAELPTLPGLVGGLSNIRSDEGRHGVRDGETEGPRRRRERRPRVPPGDGRRTRAAHAVYRRRVGRRQSPGLGENDLVAYAAERHMDRMTRIADSGAGLPSVAEPTRLEENY